MQPTVQDSRDQRHDQPGQQYYHGGIEHCAADDKGPIPDCQTQRPIQNHREGKNPQESCDGHLPSWWWIVWRTKPRLEAMQLAVFGLAFGQGPGPFIPRFELWRFVEIVAFLFIVKCSQDAELARVGTRQRRQHAGSQHTAVIERRLQELTERLLKLSFAAELHPA